jgi:hypothetical protein
VAYRSHWLGINTTQIEEEEILKISSRSKRKKIILVNDLGKSITINLETLSIDGATINGGTW